MVVVDSSALIPLARAGRLHLIKDFFETVRSTNHVFRETVKESKGKKGTSELKEAFDEWIQVEETKGKIQEVSELEGIEKADAAVILLAEEKSETLLANDKALIGVARSRGVECYWVTSLLLESINQGLISKEEGKKILYDLVEEGMNLKPTVYARIRKEIQRL